MSKHASSALAALELAVVAVAKNLASLLVSHIGIVEQAVELLGDFNHVNVIGLGIQRVRDLLNAKNAVDRRRATAPRERHAGHCVHLAVFQG